MSRSRCIVEGVKVSPILVTGNRPFRTSTPASIEVTVRREIKGGPTIRAILAISLGIGYLTDGASTFWPVSLLVPPWRDGEDEYNAGPVTHDILYMFQGLIPDISSPNEPVKLSREEVDDILRGIWRCWGMSRFLAGCADKGVEIFAGGKRHWGSDTYGVADKVCLSWTPIPEAA